jgi:hypothetical protein
MATKEKTHYAKTLAFDSLMFQDYDLVPAVSASTANTTILAYLVLPQRAKIFKVSTNYTAIGAGPAYFNMVIGVAAEAVTPQVVDQIFTNANAGYTVFATDQQLTNAANLPQSFIPPTFDTIYDTNTLLTLRAVTPAGTTITNFKVACALKFLDAGPSFTGLYPF